MEIAAQQKIGNAEYCITTDRSVMNLEVIHRFLTNTYWAKGRKKELIKKSMQNSLCFAVLNENQQVGFARVITDYAIFAYLADVFILPTEQGKGLGKWLLSTILDYPELKPTKGFLLATKDAHGLYRQFGFTSLEQPEKMMQRKNLP